jgi:homoserine kinase
MESVTAYAYSSSANLGPGFDILALAHNAFYDTVEVGINSSDNLEILIDAENIPLEFDKNSAGYAIYKMLNELGIRAKVKLRIQKGIPIGLGLGSSGASAAAAVSAVNEVLKLGLKKEELVKFAMIGEYAVAGSPHPDNVAASLFGGVVLVNSLNPIKITKIPVNINFKILLLIPDMKKIENKTKKAREMIPESISIKYYIENSRNLASLILGLINGNRELIRLGLNDNIIEKSRLPLFPFYPKIKEIALKTNAIGACVSGAGPSILVFIDDETKINLLLDLSKEVFSSYSLNFRYVITTIGEGVRIERRK